MEKRAYRFIFTLNNYTEEQVEHLKKDFECSYICFGREIGPQNGTPHLQGYMEFKYQTTVSALKKRIENLYAEPAKGDQASNHRYTSKDNDWFERGTSKLDPIQKGQQERDQWERARELAREGRFDDIPARIFVRSKRAFEEIHREHQAKLEKLEEMDPIPELRTWQSELVEIIKQTPDPRKVYWYVDEKGGQGKTTISNYLEHHHGAFIIDNGRSRDLAQLLPRKPPIVIFDFVRSMEDHVNYQFIESVKNGRVISHKYQGEIKRFPKPHVIIFANFPPDKTKLSADRWHIINFF